MLPPFPAAALHSLLLLQLPSCAFPLCAEPVLCVCLPPASQSSFIVEKKRRKSVFSLMQKCVMGFFFFGLRIYYLLKRKLHAQGSCWADLPSLHAWPQLHAGGEKGEVVRLLCPVLTLLGLALQLGAEWPVVALTLWMAWVHLWLQESCAQTLPRRRAVSARALVSIFAFPFRVHKMLTFKREVPLVYLCQ